MQEATKFIATLLLSAHVFLSTTAHLLVLLPKKSVAQRPRLIVHRLIMPFLISMHTANMSLKLVAP